ncbi:MAG: hypothetical protein ACOYJY_06870 [Acutalibacteraceae bacterium]|jgi:hypothetical protein
MARFTYTMDDASAVLKIKQAMAGKAAILKDKGNELTVGSPMMTVKITVQNGTVTTNASLAGKMLLSTIDSLIEITEGFTKG